MSIRYSGSHNFEARNRIRSRRLEGFKPTDNLSPSETAAVVSAWTRDSFVDSWKYDSLDGSEDFSGEIKDTFAPMDVYVDKKHRLVSISYLGLNQRDIDSLVEFGLSSRKDADEAFVEDIGQELHEGFYNEHYMDVVEMDMPVTQVELEKELDACKRQALDAYDRLESAFYDAVEGVRESRIRRRRR